MHRMKTRFDNAYVLNIMSDDHPGIISAVSSTVARLGGNIDLASQTVVGGYFTLIMIVSLPAAAEPDALAAEVRTADPGASLQVVARPYLGAHATARGTGRFVITAFGPDKPGLIAHFSRYLAGKDVNITDFYWSREGDDFVMISQVEIPAAVDFGALQTDLEEIGREEGFTVKLQHENIFVATNQLRLTRQA
jgi:glycine cleavage system transcriptional repressor